MDTPVLEGWEDMREKRGEAGIMGDGGWGSGEGEVMREMRTNGTDVAVFTDYDYSSLFL